MVLLRQIGAVAQISQAEDVGCDGIVTLLPRSESDTRMLNASHSFWVQIKTSGVKSVRYKHKEAQWLVDLQLPFFFGRMDSAETRLDVYATTPLWDLSAAGYFSIERSAPSPELTFHFEPNENEAGFYLGNPILSWHFREFEGIEKREARDNGVDVMADWCEGWHRNRLLWPLNIDLRPQYETNRVPSRWSRTTRHSSDPADLSRIAAEGIDHIEALVGGLLLAGDKDTAKVMRRALKAIQKRHPLPQIAEGLQRIAGYFEHEALMAEAEGGSPD